MTTFYVTVNVRAGYGDAVKEALVGIYQTDNPDRFRKAFEKVVEYASKRSYHPQARITRIKDDLGKFGFFPITLEPLFAPIG